jgi:hypothetical protein
MIEPFQAGNARADADTQMPLHWKDWRAFCHKPALAQRQ